MSLSLKKLADRNDAWHVLAADAALQGTDWTAVTLQAHLAKLFSANTEQGTKTKFTDWHIYVKWAYQKQESLPDIDDIQWPPNAK